jgi:hypothetical protein
MEVPTMDALDSWLRRLAVACFGMSLAGNAAIARELTAIPERAIDDVIEASEEDGRWPDRDRSGLLALLSHDARAAVDEAAGKRLAIARALRGPARVVGGDLALSHLAGDRDEPVRRAALVSSSRKGRSPGRQR